MSRTSSHRSRRRAAVVLAGLGLFLVASDPRAGCLAAWLCPPPAAQACAHEAGSALRPASELCDSEGRFGHAFQRLDPVRLDVWHLAPGSAELAGAAPAVAGFALALPTSGATGESPPLYRLHASLLI